MDDAFLATTTIVDGNINLVFISASNNSPSVKNETID
jgi:hypothetical protein